MPLYRRDRWPDPARVLAHLGHGLQFGLVGERDAGALEQGRFYGLLRVVVVSGPGGSHERLRELRAHDVDELRRGRDGVLEAVAAGQGALCAERYPQYRGGAS